MNGRSILLAAMLALALCLAPATAEEVKELKGRDIVALGKSATALVEIGDDRSFGSAFCIGEKGLFLTNSHVVRGARGGGRSASSSASASAPTPSKSSTPPSSSKTRRPTWPCSR